VVSFREDGTATSIIEKPENPASDWAVIGLYFYDGTAPERARALPRSARDEYEITDLNNTYLTEGSLHVEPIGRGFAWFDAGTHTPLLEASEFVRIVQQRQRQLIAAPEEIAYGAGWISAEQVERSAEQLSKTDYGAALAALLDK